MGRIVLAAPPLALATATLTGLGLVHGLPTGLALAAGVGMSFLPAIGLGTLFSGSEKTIRGWSAWVWCAAVLLALPLYFPGDRELATQEGTRHLVGWLGPANADSLGRAAGAVVGLLGSDSRPLAPSIDEALQERSKSTPPSPSASQVPPPAKREAAAPETVRIPYLGDKSSLRIEAHVDGPESGELFTLLFDTGATFTTLNRESLDALGLSIPPDAPRVTLQTANGRLEAELVLVDAIWLGDSPVEWVTVAVCESCASKTSVGLLGLNVSQRFQVALDHDRREISFERRGSGDDRSLDIRNWLRIRSQVTKHWDGRIEVDLQGFNDARQEIRSAVVRLECSGQSFAIQLDAIPPLGEASVQVELPREADCSEQELELTRAYWGLDRFE
ncbi:MAG: retropepsin-like aspartic protease [Myxococcota bacterium]|nr:retropepsin-like aspartic protease [Myxococcota bacterium]